MGLVSETALLAQLRSSQKLQIQPENQNPSSKYFTRNICSLS